MFNLFKRLTGRRSQRLGMGEVPSGDSYDWAEHEGYEIAAAPIKEPSGWRVAGAVLRVVDGERRIHRFVRADICSSRDDAEQIALSKARQIVKEGGPKNYEVMPG